MILEDRRLIRALIFLFICLLGEFCSIAYCYELKIALPSSIISEGADSKELIIIPNTLSMKKGCMIPISDKKKMSEKETLISIQVMPCMEDYISNYLANVKGFEDSPFSLQDFNYKIDPQDMIVTLKISPISDDALVHYWVNNQDISNKWEVTFSLKEIKEEKEVEFQAKSKDGEKTYDQCNFKYKFGSKQLQFNYIALNKEIQCIEGTIEWPEKWVKPLENDCIDGRIEGSRLRCLRQKGSRVRVYFSAGWTPVEITADELDKGQVKIDMPKLIPAWPFKKDLEGIEIAGGDGDPCQVKPRYRPVLVYYCQTERLVNCKKGEISEGNKLPNLLEIGWDKDFPLPQYFFLDLEMISGNNPRYKMKPKGIGPLGLSGENIDKRLQEVIDEEKILERLHATVKTTEIPYNPNYKFLLFDNENICKKDISSAKLSPYTLADIEALEADSCSYAKVVKGKKDESLCERAELLDNQNVAFNIKSIRREGKRLVVVIPNSVRLGSKGRGVAIQDGLLDWLKELKEDSSPIPMTLLTIEEDGVAELILNSEELDTMSISGDDPDHTRSIMGEINNEIIFTGSGFHPLNDISSVEDKLIKERIEANKVIYFTDGQVPQDVRFHQLGTPLGWDDSGVKLYIATVSDCELWEKRAKAKQCVFLKENVNKDELKRLLNKFVIDH